VLLAASLTRNMGGIFGKYHGVGRCDAEKEIPLQGSDVRSRAFLLKEADKNETLSLRSKVDGDSWKYPDMDDCVFRGRCSLQRIECSSVLCLQTLREMGRNPAQARPQHFFCTPRTWQAGLIGWGRSNSVTTEFIAAYERGRRRQNLALFLQVSPFGYCLL
jgi:hypothetical protein